MANIFLTYFQLNRYSEKSKKMLNKRCEVANSINWLPKSSITSIICIICNLLNCEKRK